MKNLFLDDVRQVKDAFIIGNFDFKSLEEASSINNWCWDIVRNYDQFVKYVEENGIPHTVSFDHDLSQEAVEHYMKEARLTGVFEYGNLKDKTGLHCALYLLDKCIKEKKPFPKYYIHSANEIGRNNIKKEIEEFTNRYPFLKND
jgi:hypothetical protein